VEKLQKTIYGTFASKDFSENSHDWQTEFKMKKIHMAALILVVIFFSVYKL